MGIFEKKESNEEYRVLRDSAINSWSLLVTDNPFAPAKELKDKWAALYQQINKAYKLSQKYSDTEADIPLLKNYLDDSLRRFNEYTYEIEADQLKYEYFDVCERYERTLEERYESESGLWNDNYELMTRFDGLYKSALRVLNMAQKYTQYDIDLRLINDICSNSAFYYCASILRMTEDKENEPLGRARDLYYQYLRECEKTAIRFNEGRFIVIRGVSCERRALFCQATSRGSDDMHVVNSLIDESVPCLSLVENYDYCLSVIKKHLPGYSDPIHHWDWNFMMNAVIALKNVYSYKGKYDKARNVVNISIKAHQNSNFMAQWNDVINVLINIRNEII